MKRDQAFLVTALLLGSLQMGTAADISGKITLKGTPPPEKEIPLDPMCGALRPNEKLKTRFYMVGEGGGLADVFVYLKSGVASKPAPAGPPPVLDQVGCEYVPYVMGLQANQKLLVRNSDPVLHNVHPTPSVAGNKEANVAQPMKSKDLEFVFANPEVLLRFKCDVHPWMFAYVGVVEHPYFAVTDKNGNFKISNVPAGKYVIEAVHRKTHFSGKGITQEITVGPETAKADFTIALP